MDTSLLIELRDFAQKRMGPLWLRVLERSDDLLFDLSQQGNGSEEASYFEALRELRRQRSEIEVRCRSQLEREFRGLLRLATAAGAGPDRSSNLSLVDADALEGQLACEHLAAAMERKHAEPIARFVCGLGRMLESEQFNAQDSPLAPQRMAAILRDLIAPSTPWIPAQLVVMKALERVLDSEYGPLLDDLTTLMATRGVDVELPPPRLAAPAPQPVVDAKPAAATAAAAPPKPAVAHAGNDGLPDNGPGIPDELFQLMRSLFASYLGPDRQCADDTVAGVMASAARDARQAGPQLSTDVAIEALTRMQRKPQPLLLQALHDQQLALGGLLRQALLEQVVGDGLAPAGVQLQLRDEQGLTLVGMLFDVLLDQGHFLRDFRERLVRLVVPYAKVALLDQRLFALKTHPARRLLNAITEACEANHGVTSTDRDVLLRVTVVTERLLRDFTDNSALFVELEQRFREYNDQHRQRSALAEKRATEAQRGRERLQDARLDASLELASLVGDRVAPKPLADFFSQDWCHHLTLVALRSGSDSDAYRTARATGVALWMHFIACEQGAPVPRPFGEALVPVFASCGHVGAAADAMIERLRVALEASRPQPERAVAADQIAQRVLAGLADEAAPAAERDDLTLSIARHAARAEDVERVREIKVGDWVEIVDSNGQSQPAKLSWISPISSRLLFVNRRGIRLCVLSPEEMAGLVAEGKLTVRSVGAAFERAMTQIVGSLKGDDRLVA